MSKGGQYPAQIFETIFAEEAGDDDSISPTLTILARTCTAFSNPALDVLWYELYGLVQLFCILPSSKWTLLPTEEPSLGKLTIVRPLTKDDWTRCFQYWARVKVLHLMPTQLDTEYADMHPFDVDLRSVAAIPASSGPLFPSSNKLQCKWVGDAIPLYSRFLSPTLRHLEVQYAPQDYDPYIALFFDKVGSDVPLLEHFELEAECDDNDDDTPMPIDLHDSLPNIQGLRRFIATKVNLTADTIHSFSSPQFSHLETVSFGHPSTNLLDWIGEGPLTIASLRNLSITVPVHLPLTNATDVLSRINCKAVQRLNINTWSIQVPSSAEFCQLFQGLTDNFDISHLTALCIVQHERGDFVEENWEGSKIPQEAVEHLFKFKNLNRLSMLLESQFPMDDVNIENIAKAWPEMRVLRLGKPLPYPDIKTACSLSSLRHFARHCPKLLSLSLPAVKPFVDIATVESADITRSKLRVLNVGLLRLTALDINPMAVYLSTLFPEIERVGESTSRLSDGWDDVMVLLPFLALVRQQERRGSAVAYVHVDL